MTDAVLTPAPTPTAPPAGEPAAPPASGFDWAASLGSRHGDFAPVLEAKKWDSPAAVLDAYVNLERLTGARVADPAAYPAFGVPDGLSGFWTAEMDGAFRQAALEAGLTDKQAQGVHGWYMQRLQTGLEERQRAGAQVEQSLRQEFGQEYDTRITQARRAVERFGASAFLDALEERAGGVEMVKFFANIGAAFAEDSLAGGSPAPLASPKQEIDALTLDPAFQGALWDRANPGHAAAKQKWEELHRRAFA